MPARYFALLCDLLEARGVKIEAMLRSAGLARAQIYGPDATITVEQFEALVAASTQASGRSDLGFLLGREIKLSSHEILGFGILTSPTLDDALRLAARYYRLITPAFRMQYRRDAQRAELRFQPLLPLNPQATQFLCETVVISAHEQVKTLAQRNLPDCDIYVSYDEPPDSQRYRELLPTRVHFGDGHLPGARLAMDATAIAQKLPMASRSALKMAEERCEELLRKTVETGGVTGWVNMMLREARDSSPTLAELAALLNQSPRTLDRHLDREGSRFLELSKRIRHEKACELLRVGALSVTQIAYQLGYKDASNFTRAFSREAGQSPSEFRRGAGAGPPVD